MTQQFNDCFPLVGGIMGQLVLSKFALPSLPSDYVCRPRLQRRLESIFELELLLVVAPAGFGKTTILCDWALQQNDAAVAWLTLDKEDNRSGRFLQYVCAALSAVRPGLGDATLARLNVNPWLPINQAMACFCHEVGEVREEVVIILDDYHWIENSIIHEGLTFLVNHMPKNCHLILGSRAIPALPIWLWRAQQRVSELEAAALRFSRDEIQDFYERALGIRMDVKLSALLEQRTEGWVAALRLNAINVRHHDDPSKVLTSSSKMARSLSDYFMEEALRCLPKMILDFLVRISILERFSGALCEAVTGLKKVESILATLVRMNMFIVLLDDQKHWFRFHHLFVAALHEKLLCEDTDGSLVAGLHVRAGVWFEDQGFLDEAFGHYLSAKDYQKAARLIENNGLTLMKRADQVTVANWLERMPREIVDSRPWLMVISAWGGLLGHNMLLESILKHAEKMAPRSADEQLLLGHIKTFRAFVALQKQKNPPLAIARARRALEHLSKNDPRTIRDIAYLIMASAHLNSGDIRQAWQLYEKSYHEAMETGNFNILYRAAGNLADLQVAMGMLDKAVVTCNRTLEAAGTVTGGDHYFAGRIYVCLGNIARERNQLAEAQRLIARGKLLAKGAGDNDAYALAMFGEARIFIAKGDITKARQAFQEIDGPGAECSTILWDSGLRAELRLDLLLLNNELDEAEKIVRAKKLALSDQPNTSLEPEYYAWARLLLANGQARAASRLLEGLSIRAQKEGVHGRLVKILVLLALARNAEENSEQALETLGQAIALGEPQGYVRSFLDEGSAMGELLSLALDQGRAATFVRALMAEGERETCAISPVQPVDPLSTREMQVLRLLASGLSNREIADNLDLALGTIKAHLANIFKKLKVKSRSQAIVRARNLGVFR